MIFNFNYLNVSINQLVYNNVYIGHSNENTLFFTSWILSILYQNI